MQFLWVSKLLSHSSERKKTMYSSKSELEKAVRWYCDTYLNTRTNPSREGATVTQRDFVSLTLQGIRHPIRAAALLCARMQVPPSPVRHVYTLENFVRVLERSVTIKGSQSLESPVKVEWNITAKCNMKCGFCYTDGVCENGTSRELSTSEALNVVREIGENNVIEVQIEGGEPFMREDLLDIVAALKEKRHRVRLLTNGTLLTSRHGRRLREFLDGNDVLQISLHGSTPGVHDAHVGIPGSFSRVMRTMSLLGDAGVPVRVSTVVTPSNLDDLPSIVDVVHQHPDVQVFVAQPVIPIGRGTIKDVVSTAPLLRKYHEIALHQGAGHRMGLSLLLGHAYDLLEMRSYIRQRGIPKEIVFCSAARSRLHIDARGNVYPCHFLADESFKAGNLRDQSLRELWYSAVFDRVRAGRGKNAVCAGCEMGPYCTKKGLCTSYAADGNIDSQPINCLFPAGCP